MPSTSTINPIGAVEIGTDTSTTPTRRDEAPRPSFDDVLDALSDLGYKPRKTARLLRRFHKLAGRLERIQAGDAKAIAKAARHKAEEGMDDDPCVVFCEIDPNSSFHELLERVMPDLQVAEPGTPHDTINRHFLGDSHVFLHDYVEGCMLAVVPR